jgi:hypothetical protein
MKGLLAAVIVVAAAVPALGQERPPSSLFLSGHVESGAALSGAAGELQWMQSVSDTSSVIVGGGSGGVADAWWSYGRLGGFTKLRGYTVVGSADLGHGAEAGAGFPYAKWDGTVTSPAFHRFDVEAGAQSVYATHLATHVLKVGGGYTGSRAAVRVAVHRSSMQSTDWHYVSGRVDVPLGRVTMAGGLTAGTQSASPDSSVLSLLAHTSRDAFVALSIARPRAQTTVAIEAIDQPSGRLDRLTVGVRLPVGASAAGPPREAK